MKRLEGFLDWFFIITSPAIAFAIYVTDDVRFLRFLAVLWLIGAILQSAIDRLEAYAEKLR